MCEDALINGSWSDSQGGVELGDPLGEMSLSSEKPLHTFLTHVTSATRSAGFAIS
jgi:hypothetical protein